jgi:DNA-binding MarR family transcriptional regulator
MKKPISKPVPSREDALVDTLAQAAFATMAVLSKVGAEHDLSLTQLRVLAILRDRRLRMAELADYLGLEKSTLSGLVDRAERRGLVARATSTDDGRAVEVLLTGKGEEFAQRITDQVRQSLSPLIRRLDAADQRHTQRLLARMLTRPLRGQT